MKGDFMNFNHAALLFRGMELPMPLSAEEEKRLLSISSFDLEARNTLIERNIRLVIYTAKRFENTRIPLEDLVSIGTIGLVKSIQTFSSKKNVKLASYANRCITNEILMFIRNNKKHTSVTMALEDIIATNTDGSVFKLQDIVPDKKGSIYESYENQDLICRLLSYVLNSFPYRKSLILLYSIGQKKQTEIASILGISRSYISRDLSKMHTEIQNFLQRPKEMKKKDFIFSPMTEDTFCLQISQNWFIHLREKYHQFLLKESISFPIVSNFSLTSSCCGYYQIELPFDEISFIYLADFLHYLSVL